MAYDMKYLQLYHIVCYKFKYHVFNYTNIKLVNYYYVSFEIDKYSDNDII